MPLDFKFIKLFINTNKNEVCMSDQITSFEERCDCLESMFDVKDYSQYVEFDDFCTANNLFTRDKMLEALPRNAIWMMEEF
jgi:hypothetical protein